MCVCVRECVFSLSKCFRSNSCHPCPFPPPPPSGLPVFHAHRDPAPLPPVRAREEGWGPSTEAGLTLPRVTHRPFSNLYIMTMGSCLCPRPSGEGPESPRLDLLPLFLFFQLCLLLPQLRHTGPTFFPLRGRVENILGV